MRISDWSSDVCSSDLRYPPSAFCPQGTWEGATMGANADTALNRLGKLSAIVSAPCPPIEWPRIDCRSRSAGKFAPMRQGSSSVTEVHILYCWSKGAFVDRKGVV